MIPWCLISFEAQSLFILVMKMVYARDAKQFLSWYEAIFIKRENLRISLKTLWGLVFFVFSPALLISITCSLHLYFLFHFFRLAPLYLLFVFSLLLPTSPLSLSFAPLLIAFSFFCCLLLLLYIMCTFGFWSFLFQIIAIVLFFVFAIFRKVPLV